MNVKKDTLNTNNTVTFDVNTIVLADDKDVLELYLSNKNQAGPNGDIVEFQLADNQKQLIVTYEHSSSKEKVLTKKFFAYKQYFIRSSESGYMNETFDFDQKTLILYNIENDRSMAELFAEYLLPDNEMTEIKKSEFYPGTFYITYQDPIDQELVQKRYLKKKDLLKSPVEYLPACQTSTVLIRPKHNANINQLMKKLVDDIYTRLGPKPNVFLDQTLQFVVCQFMSNLDTQNFLRLIENYLQQNQLVSEYCYSFKLIKNFQEATNDNSTRSDKKTQTELGEKAPVEDQYESVYMCFNQKLKGLNKYSHSNKIVMNTMNFLFLQILPRLDKVHLLRLNTYRSQLQIIPFFLILCIRVQRFFMISILT